MNSWFKVHCWQVTNLQPFISKLPRFDHFKEYDPYLQQKITNTFRLTLEKKKKKMYGEEKIFFTLISLL